MVLTKLWFILLALAAAAALAMVPLVSEPAWREIERAQQERLDRAQYAAELDIKIGARGWIDQVSQLASDAVIVDGTDRFATVAPEDAPVTADAALVHRTVQERLRRFNDQLHADLLIAVDSRGKVVARAGADEDQYRDGLIGTPLCAAVLRGYRRDDTWAVGGELMQMAGAPVIGRARDRYVGAILAGRKIGGPFARSLADRVGTEVAVLLRGKVVAQSYESPALLSVPTLLGENKAIMKQKGRTPALPLDSGRQHFLAVLAPFAGEAAGQEAVYVLFEPRMAAEGFAGLLRRSDKRDITEGMTPIVLGVGLIGVIAIGMLLFFVEHGSPLSRLVVQARDLAKGTAAKIDDASLRGKFGTIGRSVNELVERLSKGKPASRDLGSLLGPPPEAVASREGSGVHRGFGPPSGTYAPMGGPAPSVGLGSMTNAPAAPLSFGAPLPPSGRAVPPMARPPTPPPVSALKPGVGALSSRPMHSAGPPLPPGAAPPPPPISSSFPAPPSMRLTPPPVSAGSATGDDYLKQVYEEYVSSRRKNGEEADSVDFARFAAKLRDNRDQILSRYNCREVKFIVYVKDGRTAVKATPVKA